MKKEPASDTFFEDDATDWLVTYADLMTLLLVFFVLLFSLSSLNMANFKEILESVRVNPGTGEPTQSLIEFMDIPDILETELTLEQLTGLKKLQKPTGIPETDEEEVVEEINQFITQKRIGEHVVLEILDGKITIRIRGNVLFRSGSASLTRNSGPLLDELMTILDEYTEYNINIKGHTDNRPISTPRFSSNWELSAIRATSVLQYLIDRGIPPERLTATGYGDILPIVPNNTPQNRAINRRVEFVLEKENQ